MQIVASSHKQAMNRREQNCILKGTDNSVREQSRKHQIQAWKSWAHTNFAAVGGDDASRVGSHSRHVHGGQAQQNVRPVRAGHDQRPPGRVLQRLQRVRQAAGCYHHLPASETAAV